VVGVSIVVVVVVAAVAVVTAAQGNLFWLGGQPPTGNACPAPAVQVFQSGPFTLGQPLETAKGPNHWYNFSVIGGESCLLWGNLALQVVTATGANITPLGNWSAGVLSESEIPLAEYDFLTGTWTGGADTLLASPQTLVVDSAGSSLSAKGDGMDVLGVGTIQGSLYVAIP
jgi:hypothetical protein